MRASTDTVKNRVRREDTCSAPPQAAKVDTRLSLTIVVHSRVDEAGTHVALHFINPLEETILSHLPFSRAEACAMSLIALFRALREPLRVVVKLDDAALVRALTGGRVDGRHRRFRSLLRDLNGEIERSKCSVAIVPHRTAWDWLRDGDDPISDRTPTAIEQRFNALRRRRGGTPTAWEHINFDVLGDGVNGVSPSGATALEGPLDDRLTLAVCPKSVMMDAIADYILSEKFGRHPVCAEFQVRLRGALVDAERSHGTSLSLEQVLRDLVGDRALAHAVLAEDFDPLVDRIAGVDTALVDMPETTRRRWCDPPYQLFQRAFFEFRVPFVIARQDTDDDFEAFWPIDLVMDVLGAGPDLRARLDQFRRRRVCRTFRVHLDGRVERLRCVAAWRMQMLLANPSIELPEEPRLRGAILACRAASHKMSMRFLRELGPRLQ